jgi:hypothetical protein
MDPPDPDPEHCFGDSSKRATRVKRGVCIVFDPLYSTVTARLKEVDYILLAHFLSYLNLADFSPSMDTI